MNVTVSGSAGFCVGVKMAIEKAIKAAGGDTPIFMLGDIVHNEFVVCRMEEKGIRKIERLENGKGKTLLIRAHGAPASVYEQAAEAGFDIIDATCPMVKEIHETAKKDEREGRMIIVIGDEKHDEVMGIVGSLERTPLVLNPSDELPADELEKIEKASVVVQSTQNSDTVKDIVERLSCLIEDLRFHDTICSPTKNRQKDARILPLENDAMVVIGSRGSANTRRLYEISRSLNDKTCWIASHEDIDPSFFKGAENVGVLAGASTPDEVIEEVVSALKAL